MSAEKLDAEILIVGAGMSGLCAASELLKRNISCLVIEKEETYPDYFRAERTDFNSEPLFNEFGISAIRSPEGPALGKGIAFERRTYGLRGTRVEYDLPGGHGIRYNDTVNNFRKQVVASGCIRYGLVFLLLMR